MKTIIQYVEGLMILALLFLGVIGVLLIAMTQGKEKATKYLIELRTWFDNATLE